jgi:hypothetical protein
MSLNLDDVGRPLAKIVGGRRNNKIVSVFDREDDDIKKEFPFIRLNDDETFQHIPSNLERDCLYICGASGSGKSTYSAKFIKEYQKKNKKNPCYLFSAKNEDAVLDDLGIKRIKINESLIENPIKAEEMANSLIIYDDIDVIQDKTLRKAVWESLNLALQVCRALSTTVIITNHLPTMGKDTGIVLFECHSITFFPNDLNRKLRYMLENYCGLSQKEIDKLCKIKSRAITIFRHYPKVILCERIIFMMSELDNLFTKGFLN